MITSHVRPSVSWVLGVALCLSCFVNIVLLSRVYSDSVVESVFDGDSFELADGRRVRLMGADAPEAGRCMSAEARDYLRSHVLGRRVRLKHTIVDGYGRDIAIVIIEDWLGWREYMYWKGRSAMGIPAGVFPDPLINRVMVYEGLARFTGTDTVYHRVLQSASEHAKRNRLGIYSDQCRNATHPPGCDIKGNVRNGDSFYFVPGCKPYGNVIVDESYGDRWFCSTEDAERSGFTRSQTCAYRPE